MALSPFRPLHIALLAALLATGCGQAASALAGAAPAGELAAAGKRAKAKWTEGAVVYGAVPPLFGDSPLKDLTARLDDIHAQGADAVWLSPIYATDDPSAISYAVTDYTAIRPDFGAKEDFKRLVTEAHRLGMRVLLDFVPNHTSDQHPFYQDAQKRGPESPYWDFYMRDKGGKPQFYFDWKNLINLNYGNAGVQRMMTESFAYWVREFDVDGFRVDAAWGVKDRNPGFWPKLSKSLHAIKSDVFLLAEASARDGYYVSNGFDAAYDWNKELGHWAWEKAFDDPGHAGDLLRAALGGKETPPEQVARFINNNDTGARFITRHGLATQRVAAVLQHTLPGLPVVYNGDEVGAEFEPYEDPEPLSWADPHQLKPFYRRLAELRHTLPALRRGDWRELKFDKKLPGVYAFTRDAGNGQAVLVALNFGKAAKVTLDLPVPLRGNTLSDALAGRAWPTDPGHTTITLPMSATSALVLAPAP